MKTIRIILSLLLVPFFGMSQTIEKFSIDSGGASATSLDGTIEILYTIGEVNVQEFADASLQVSEGFINEAFKIKIDPIVFLQGPMLNPTTAGQMNDDLRVAVYLPTTSPYADMATCDASVFNATGNNAIVDWVWVELRAANDNTKIVNARSALLQRDGDVVNLDGVSNLIMTAAPTSYFVVVKHRNHLGAMSATTIALNEATTTVVDFTNSGFSTFGTNAQVQLATNNMAFWSGNVNGDTFVQYSGTNPDSPSILSEVLNDPGNFLNFPTYIVSGYNTHDVNMDGDTQYTGTNPDTPLLLQNVLAHPGNFLNFSTYQIQEQLPEN